MAPDMMHAGKNGDEIRYMSVSNDPPIFTIVSEVLKSFIRLEAQSAVEVLDVKMGYVLLRRASVTPST